MDDYEEDIPAPPLSRSAVRRIARAVLACSAIVFVGIMAIFRLPLQETPLLAPVVLAFAGAGLTLLSLRARERAEQPDV
jgi:archaellum biogenesis protein FlaJ (TadC family)